MDAPTACGPGRRTNPIHTLLVTLAETARRGLTTSSSRCLILSRWAKKPSQVDGAFHPHGASYGSDPRIRTRSPCRRAEDDKCAQGVGAVELLPGPPLILLLTAGSTDPAQRSLQRRVLELATPRPRLGAMGAATVHVHGSCESCETVRVTGRAVM